MRYRKKIRSEHMKGRWFEEDEAGKIRGIDQESVKIKSIKNKNMIEGDRIKRLAKFYRERARDGVARNSKTSYWFSALGKQTLLRRWQNCHIRFCLLNKHPYSALSTLQTNGNKNLPELRSRYVIII